MTDVLFHYALIVVYALKRNEIKWGHRLSTVMVYLCQGKGNEGYVPSLLDYRVVQDGSCTHTVS